jgi:hypothetical protein
LASLSSSKFCIGGMEVSLFRHSEDVSIGELQQQHPLSSQRHLTSHETRQTRP